MLAYLKNFKKISKETSKLPVLIVGSVEQHGPFMPIGTDTLLAEAIYKGLDNKLGNKALIFPVMPFGVAGEHLGFAGTIAIKHSTYLLLLEDILESLVESGFKKVLIISTHGGNDKTIKEFQNKNLGIKVNYIFAFDTEVDKKAEELFGGVDKHAGSSENSIIAYLYPQTVSFIGKKKNKLFNPNSEGIFKKYKTKEVTDLGIVNFSDELEVDSVKGKVLFNYMIKRLCDLSISLIKY